MLHGWQHISEREEHLIREGIRDGRVYGGPFHVELGPTDSCNYKCFFCNAAQLDRTQRLPWERLSRLLEELHAMGMRSLRLAGSGEPLIYPEIERVLDFCVERGVHVSNVTTNGYKLSPSVADRLLRAGCDEVIVSFNDVTPEKYAKTNGTTERSFDVVLENIRHLVSERDRLGLAGPNVIQQFFVWKGNFAEIERAYDIALACGANHLYLRDMSGLEPKDRMSEDELRAATEAIGRLRERDRGVGKLLLGFSHEALPNAPAPEPPPPPRSRAEYCYIAWYSTVILGNGDVTPCCMMSGNPDSKPLANLHEFESFRQIWEGAAYQRLRNELREIALGRGDYGAVAHPCHTQKFCSLLGHCPFIDNLARPEFYAATDAELEPLRPKKSAFSRLIRHFKGK